MIMLRWTARLRDPKFPGGISMGGLETAGTVTLHMLMAGAGVHTGREVEMIVDPVDLDVVKSIIDRAIEVRDGTGALMARIADASERTWREANGL